MKTRRTPAAGFTLIELMITVAVIGLLTAVAYPSYLTQIKKSHRSDAKAALLGMAQSLERYYSEHASYVGATLGSGGVYVGTSASGYYTLTLGSLTASGFSASATPAGAQVGDDCGNFTYDQTGTKGVSGGTLAATACW